MFDQKIINFFHLLTNFWSSKPWIRIGAGSGSVFSLKCWIRIRNTAYRSLIPSQWQQGNFRTSRVMGKSLLTFNEDKKDIKKVIPPWAAEEASHAFDYVHKHNEL
jgi:hypothetical protein